MSKRIRKTLSFSNKLGNILINLKDNRRIDMTTIVESGIVYALEQRGIDYRKADEEDIEDALYEIFYDVGKNKKIAT